MNGGLWGAMIATAGVVVVAAGWKWWGVTNAPVWSILLLPAGFLIGAALGSWRVPTRVELARFIDRRFSLRDRAASALQLNSDRHDQAFREFVRSDADRAIGGITSSSVVPIRVSPTFILIPVGLVLAWLLHQYLPSRPETADQPKHVAADAAVEAANAIKQAAIPPEADLPRDEPLDALERIDDLAALMAEQSDPQAVQQTAAKIEAAAQEMARSAESHEAVLDELASKFDGPTPPDTPLSHQDFQRALSSGRYGDAARIMEDLASRDPARAAEAIDDARSNLDSDPDSVLTPRTALDEQLRNSGFTQEEIERLLNEQTRSDELQRILDSQGADAAESLKDALDRLDQSEQQNDQVESMAKELSESMNEAAQELERRAQDSPAEPASRPNDAPQPAPSSKTDHSQDAANPAQQDQAESGNRSERDQSPTTRPSPTQPTTQSSRSEQNQEDRGGQSKPSDDSAKSPTEAGGDKGSGSETQKPGTGTEPVARPQRSTDDPNAEREQSQPPKDSKDPRNGTAEERRIRDPAPKGERDGPVDPSDNATPTGESAPETESPDENAPPAHEKSPSRPGSKVDQLKRALEKLEQTKQAAGRQREQAERITDAARKAYEKMTPEDRRELQQQLAKALRDRRNQGGREWGTQRDEIRSEPASPLDSSSSPIRLDDPEDPGDVTIAKWLSDESAPEFGGTAVPPPAVLHQATRAAEQALSEEKVSRRYHRALRDYFKRLGEGTSPAPAQSGP